MSREPDLAKREAWQRRLRSFDKGRATVAEFCADEGVSVATFYKWRRKLGQSLARESGSTPRPSKPARNAAVSGMNFVPVEIVGPSSLEVLLLSGTRVLVPCHEREAIRLVIAALLSALPEDRAC
jgi:transposase-like protein